MIRQLIVSRFSIYQIALTVAIFAFMKYFVFTLRDFNLYPIYIITLIAVIFSSFKYKYPNGEIAASRLLRAIVVISGFYLAVTYPGYLVTGGGLFDKPYSLKWVAVGFAVLGLWRPGFALFPLLQILWMKQYDSVSTGMHISTTDYMPIIELGVFLWIAFMVIPFFLKVQKSSKIQVSESAYSLYDVSTIIAVAIHFGNYFHSAVAKIMLDGGVFKWVLENKTHHIFLVSIQTGHSPIAGLEKLWWNIYVLFDQFYVVSNTIILFAQLVCVIAIVRIRWAILLTLFYDITHIVIFLFTGIFFWKWIILNLGIMYSLSALLHKAQPITVKVMAPFFVIFAIAIFFTARLGWYDTKILRDVYVVAVTESGDEYRVPTNYFYNTSVTFAQSRVLGRVPGHLYGSDSLGSVYKYWLLNQYNNCQPSFIKKDSLPSKLYELTWYLKNHHNYIKQNIDETGYINYDLFPHHVWSNPFLFQEFKSLDKRDITGYKIIVDSLCLEVNTDNRKITQTIFLHDEYNVRL